MSAQKNQQPDTFIQKDATRPFRVLSIAVIFVISIIIRPVIVGTG